MDLHVVDRRKEKRYRKKSKLKDVKSLVPGILKALFVPPVSLAVWFGFFGFLAMVYLTAGGQ